MVNTPCAQFNAWLSKWTLCRDTTAGEDQVKKKGELYLPKPSGQNDKEYEAYKMRAYWFNATKRTVDGLTGMIFRREPIIEKPSAMDNLVEDLTLTDSSLREFTSGLIEEVITVGRAGVLVDYPSLDVSQELTVAQVEAAGARPYVAMYQAENIVNWRYQRIGSSLKLTMVVLKESYSEIKEADPFVESFKDQYRVLQLTDQGYRQQLWRRGAGADGRQAWQAIAEVYPVINGQKFDYIPFTFIGVSRSDGVIENPPIYDLANVNVSHYRTLADLENGAHWTGLPTPVFIGLDEEKQEVALGSTTGIVLPIGGEAHFLEFTGGLDALENRAEKKAQEMALLGARILAPEKRVPETAETAAIHRAGENSVLASIALTVGESVTKTLELVRDWAGMKGDVSIKLNTDYLAVPISANTIIALTQALQAGTIAHEDFFYALQRGEIISADRDFDEMVADITNAPVTLAPAAPAGP
jgi:hypothetical protein